MFAHSIVGTLRHVDESLQNLVEQHHIAGHHQSLPITRDVVNALSDFIELLSEVHIPPRAALEELSDDDIVSDTLNSLYKSGSARVEEFDDERLSVDRIAIVESYVMVPLAATQPHAQNLAFLCEFLKHRLSETKRNVGIVRRRTNSDTAPEAQPLLAIWTVITDIIEGISSRLEHWEWYRSLARNPQPMVHTLLSEKWSVEGINPTDGTDEP